MLTVMLVMRPAAAGDQPEIADMIRARAGWMREHGLDGAGGWGGKAESLAAQATDPDVPVWACTRPGDGGRIVGITTLYEETPSWGWTDEERAQPAVFLATTVTHPDYAGQRLGCLMAWWTLEHAARAGYQHVRRGCGYPELMRYYRDIQGWQLAHTVDRHGVTAYLLTRPAERQPGIAGRITELRTMGELPAAPAAG
jgi:hypothetical protein